MTMTLVTAVPAWVTGASATEKNLEYWWESGGKAAGRSRAVNINWVTSGKRMKKIHHMTKKEIDFEVEAEVKRLEEMERLVEDANVLLEVGEDADGLTGVVSASDLAIYDDNNFLLDLGLEFGLRIGPRFG